MRPNERARRRRKITDNSISCQIEHRSFPSPIPSVLRTRGLPGVRMGPELRRGGQGEQLRDGTVHDLSGTEHHTEPGTLESARRVQRKDSATTGHALRSARAPRDGQRCTGHKGGPSLAIRSHPRTSTPDSWDPACSLWRSLPASRTDRKF